MGFETIQKKSHCKSSEAIKDIDFTKLVYKTEHEFTASVSINCPWGFGIDHRIKSITDKHW